MNARLMTYEELNQAYRENVLLSTKLEEYFVLSKLGTSRNEEEQARYETLQIKISNELAKKYAEMY